MPEHIFIKKRQRRRGRHFLTTKVILRLMVASLLTLGGFIYFIGDPTTTLCENGCESQHSLMAWIAGFFMIFAGIIALAGLTGALFAFLRWTRGSGDSAFAHLMDEEKNGN